jgi:choice-of-anchor A domain-containing protein
VNLLVLNDAFPSGADVEGRMYVGHDAVLPGGYAVNAAGTTASTNDYVLVVGNDLTVSGGTVHGTIAYGGEYSGAITATGGVVNDTPVDFEQLTDDMLYWSDTLAETPANGTVGTGGTLTLVGTDPDINVFEVQAADLAGASGMSITVPDGSTVLINVIGTDVSITNMGFSYVGTDSQHVIFNMPQAETIFMSGLSLQGTLLAPRADLNFENGNAEGQTIVNNLISGGGEYHPYYFEGCPWECL